MRASLRDRTVASEDALRPRRRSCQTHPVATTVESLAALPRPTYLPPYGRAGQTETTVFCIEGWLVDFTTEADFDIHVIVCRLENRLDTLTTDTLRVRIMVVGFFDRPHGQYGAAPNNLELHPVLGIDFP